MDVKTPNRDTSLLYPPLVARVKTGIMVAAKDGMPFAIFEGYRSPERQDYLYSLGRTEPGHIVTRAKGWQSAHSAGLAVDLALWHDGQWSWNFTDVDVKRYFGVLGLEQLDFEASHVQLTSGLGGAIVAAMAHVHGIPYVWAEIDKRMKGRPNG